MYTTKNRIEAVNRFKVDGGYLLDLGENTFAVCDEEMAVDHGRTREHLKSLAPTYSEIELDSCDIGDHEYAEKTCPWCERVFCFACCESTNVHEGGKYEPDFMHCPYCGHDYYDEVINKEIA